ncbi:MAG TPA: SCO family protein [Steroidobacteraceae bacterium]|nr:SCO family protein [Steroidobacteraceae bacterium]
MRTRTLKNHGPHARMRLMLVALSLGLAHLPAGAIAEDHSHHHHDHAMPAGQDGYVRTLAAYAVPDVQLVDADGVGVSLRGELADPDRPVILNFIFTSCAAVCPVMSATFSQVQAALGPQRDAVRMVSISIDPEQDTPAALKAYAGKYGAGPQWQMLTGSRDDSIAVQRAFDVYRGDKMNHQPATFLRAAPGQPWVRLDGFAGAADILREVRRLTAN